MGIEQPNTPDITELNTEDYLKDFKEKIQGKDKANLLSQLDLNILMLKRLEEWQLKPESANSNLRDAIAEVKEGIKIIQEAIDSQS